LQIEDIEPTDRSDWALNRMTPHEFA